MTKIEDKKNDLAVYFFRVPKNLSDKLSSDIAKTLSPEEIKFAYGYKKRNLIERALLGRYYLRLLLARHTSILPEKIEIKVGKFGKPEILNKISLKYDFSVAYSKEIIVIALGESGKVGIDVEKMDIFDRDVFHDMLSKREELSNNAVCGCDKRAEYFRIWTAKESFIKATGKGLKIPLNEIIVHGDGLTFTIEAPKYSEGFDWYGKYYIIDENYICAACVSSGQLPKNIHENNNLCFRG